MTLQSARVRGGEKKEKKAGEGEILTKMWDFFFPPLLTKHAHTSVFLCVSMCDSGSDRE